MDSKLLIHFGKGKTKFILFVRILFLKKNCLNVGVFLEKANFSTKIFFYDGPSVVKWYMWVFERSNNKLTKILANIVWWSYSIIWWENSSIFYLCFYLAWYFSFVFWLFIYLFVHFFIYLFIFYLIYLCVSQFIWIFLHLYYLLSIWFNHPSFG